MASLTLASIMLAPLTSVMALVAAAATTHPALAGDATDWSGVYAGVYGGGQAADFSDEFNGRFAGASGAVFGARFGGAMQYGAIVVGAEADIGVGTLSAIYDAGIIVGGGTIEMKALGAVNARVGAAFGRWQPFVLGGFAFGRVHDHLVIIDDTRWMTGWNAGAGVAMALTENTALTLEYRHTELGPTGFFRPTLFNTRASGDDVRFGINYRF